jgi:hypothetical protein
MNRRIFLYNTDGATLFASETYPALAANVAYVATSLAFGSTVAGTWPTRRAPPALPVLRPRRPPRTRGHRKAPPKSGVVAEFTKNPEEETDGLRLDDGSARATSPSGRRAATDSGSGRAHRRIVQEWSEGLCRLKYNDQASIAGRSSVAENH